MNCGPEKAVAAATALQSGLRPQFDVGIFPRWAGLFAREALIGAHNARETLPAGFTTVRNVGAGGNTDSAWRDAITAA